jgi:hypothetical protein
MTTTLTTSTVTVNAAFLQELKDVNHDLWRLLGDCRQLCERSQPLHRWCQRFVEQLRELCDHLAMHFALEEAYGYFDDPISVAPYLTERCCTLRAEHGELYTDLVSLVERAEQSLYERKLTALAAHIPPLFHQFHRRLMQHESLEMELVQEIFDSDIGTGD